MNLDRYINICFFKLSTKYKVNLITIMSYSNKYKRITRTYKLVIDKKTNKSKYPSERTSLDFFNKKALIEEMMKWSEKQN